MIDAHVHIFPTIKGYNGNGFIESLNYGRIRFETGDILQIIPPSFTENSCTPELLLRYMDIHFVEKAVLLTGNFYGVSNNFLYSAAKKWPDRLTFACMINPYGITAKKQINYITDDLGCKMIKLECSTDYGLSGLYPELNYEDFYFARIFEKADDLKMTIIIDTGQPNTHGYQISALMNLSNHYQNIHFVIAHLGFPPGIRDRASNLEPWKKLINIGNNKNVWFDLSSLVGLDGDEYPFKLAQEYIQYAYMKLGADKLIFGTDFPGILTKCTYQQAISFITEHCTFLNEQDKEKILEKNANYVYRW